MNEKKKTIKERIIMLFRDDDVFWNNEIRANIFVCIQLYILCGILVISYVLNEVGVFEVAGKQMLATVLITIPITLSAAIIANIFKGQKHWIKYMLCIVCVFLSVALSATLDFYVTLIIAIPVVLSVRYYSQKLTVIISIASFIGLAVSIFLFGLYGFVDLNIVSVRGSIDAGQGLLVGVTEHGYDIEKYMSALFRGSFLPRALLLSIIALSCIELSKRARNMVIEQDKVSRKTEGIKAELSMASRIQQGVLPREFPPFPDRKEFDIYAVMTPAKEVGGDFYDFYMIDDDHLGIVMADVSGKGVPAALFMMVSKMLIKSLANTGLPLNKVAEHVNNQLCSDNPVEMFVTAWIGILELSTGKLRYVDAGHEYPAIYRKSGGSFEFVKGKMCLVLGGIEGMSYDETVITLSEGDKIFLYTDGVCDATAADEEQFGRNRLLAVLNEEADADARTLINNVGIAVEEFVKTAPQFDDITMLAFTYNGQCIGEGCN